MKLLAIAIFASVSGLFLMSCADMQQAPAESLTFDSVFVAQGVSRDALYDGVKVWIAENFKSAKEVIEYDNKEQGTLIGNGSMSYPCSGLACMTKGSWTVFFTMKVDVKDDKYRLTFSNLKVGWPSSYNSTFGYQAANPGSPIVTQGGLDDVRQPLLAFGAEIESSLTQQKTKSNW